MSGKSKLSDPKRPCHGCAHSAAGAKFPGHPSGERPCCFCVRNPDGINTQALGSDKGVWYDGRTEAFKTPMDCYISTDRLFQSQIFDELERIERGDTRVARREKGFWKVFGGDEDDYCCEGGNAPGGHDWQCIAFLGVSYG